MEVHFIYFKYYLRNKGKQQERMLKESKRAHQMNWRYVDTLAVKDFMPPLQWCVCLTEEGDVVVHSGSVNPGFNTTIKICF